MVSPTTVTDGNPWTRRGAVVDRLEDVAPGDVAYLSNGMGLMVAYRVGQVVRCDGLTHLYVAGSHMKWTIGGASVMRFHGAERFAGDAR